MTKVGVSAIDKSTTLESNKSLDYMVGQFSHLERKSIEPMALQVEGGEHPRAAAVYQ